MAVEKRSAVLNVEGASYTYYPLEQIEGAAGLPLPLKVVLENILRNVESDDDAAAMAQRVVKAAAAGNAGEEVEFAPARVLFQDFTGVPVFVDFAVMREACAQLGGNPAVINPLVPCDLVIDHSVIAEAYGCADAMQRNMDIEYERNRERYGFLKWAQASFDNVRIVPPGAGICHQLNIERFADVVMTGNKDSDTEAPVAYFDTVVGTDSHTPTVNGLGVLGWGVGGIEAEAAALGQPITTLVPKVYGLHLTGCLSEGVSAMDLALSVAQVLREKGVVGCFVECFGDGVATLSATQRACVSNMTPEYGSTCTLFPVDERTIDYLKLTGRSAQQCALVEAYAKAQGCWGQASRSDAFAEVIDIDLGDIQRSLAGPSRPHEHIDFAAACPSFKNICTSRKVDLSATVDVEIEGIRHTLASGALAIAAVTSCTTATDPAMMVAAGLLARNAAEAGLKPQPWVKTILAPGSHATSMMLEEAGLMDGLRSLGFHNCGFGCMSCIGNSGPVLPAMHDIADTVELASVLSGNRNFEGRISPDISQNYLSAPAGVIAYALAGTMDFDFSTQALTAADGTQVMLADIWPTDAEVSRVVEDVVTADLFARGGRGLYDGDAAWRALDTVGGDTFAWDDASTYVRRATYFDGMEKTVEEPAPVQGARVIVNVGDFITTDHISPAGAIAPDSAAARYLRERNVEPGDFNTYGSRRGNHEVMARGTFANVKLKNLLADGKMGGWTRDMTDGAVKLIFDAAEQYAQRETPLVVLAGKMYGSGSSRDWAAKGPMLLGVRAAFAESFERIHRSNLIGMGILPLQYEEGDSTASLGLDGTETFDIAPIDFSTGRPNPAHVSVCATRPDGSKTEFSALVRIDTPTEGDYFRNGGILQYVLRKLA